LSEKTAKAYDQLAHIYDATHNDPVSLAENEVVRELLRPMIGSGDDVLDLGCGTGMLLDLIKPIDYYYTGVDISEKMLKQGRDKYPVCCNPRAFFQYGDMENLIGIPDHEADVVTSTFGSISYADPRRTAATIARVTAPGGHIFLMFYNATAYLDRPTYIIRQHNLYLHIHPVQSADIRRLYGPHFINLQMVGMTNFGRDPPYDSMEANRRALRNDVRVADPSHCYWMIVTGQRR